MSKTKTDTRSRKYQLTINNPIEKGYTHEKIIDILSNTNPMYYCLCDEKGSTYHTHMYVYYENAVYFSTMKNRFPEAHIEQARGSSSENRDYIRKEGKYKDTDKSETNIIDTFREFGEVPQDRSTKKESVSKQVFDMVSNGASNIEVITEFPSYSTKIQHLNTLRQELLFDKYSKEYRKVKVIYIFGDTGTGKTRSVLEKYGFENVYKVTNYDHPFDNYNGEKVLLLDEFRSGIHISDLLQYLDVYPCRLPARYSDKVACYTVVYIISNEDLSEQYVNIQRDKPTTWKALLRRIDEVWCYKENNIDFDCSNKPFIQSIPVSKYFGG